MITLKKLLSYILSISLLITCYNLTPVSAEEHSDDSIQETLPVEINNSTSDKSINSIPDLSSLKSDDLNIQTEQSLMGNVYPTDSVFDEVLERNKQVLSTTITDSERLKVFLDEFTPEMKEITAYFYPNLYKFLSNEQQEEIRDMDSHSLLEKIQNLPQEEQKKIFIYANLVQNYYDYYLNREEYLDNHTPFFTFSDELQYKKDIQDQVKKLATGQSKSKSMNALSATSEKYTISEFKNSFNYNVSTNDLVDPIYHTANRSVSELELSGKPGLDFSIVRSYNSLNSKLLKPSLDLGKSTSSLYYEQNGGNAAIPFTKEDRRAYIAVGWELNIPVMEKATIQAEVVNDKVSSSCSPFTASVPCYRNEYFYKALAQAYEKVVFTLENGTNYEFNNTTIVNYPYQNVKLTKSPYIENGVNKNYYLLSINDSITYKFNDAGQIVSKSNEYGDSVTYTFNIDSTTNNFNIIILDSYARKITINRDSNFVITGFTVEDDNQIIKQIKYHTTSQQNNITYREWTPSGYQNVSENVQYWRLDSVSDDTKSNDSRTIESYSYHNINSTKLADFNFNVYTPLNGYYANAVGEMLSLKQNNFFSCDQFEENQCFESHGIISNNKLTSGEIPYLLLNKLNYSNGLTAAFSYSNYDSSWRNSNNFAYQGRVSRIYQDKFTLEYIAYHPVERLDYSYTEGSSQISYSDYYENIHLDHNVQIDEFWKNAKNDNPRLRNSSRYGDRQATLEQHTAADGRMETSSNHYYVNGSNLVRDYSMVSEEAGYFPYDGYRYSYEYTDSNSNIYQNFLASYVHYEYDPGQVMPKKVSTYEGNSTFQVYDWIINPGSTAFAKSEKVSTQYSYNSMGQLVSITDANGNVTSNEFNGPFKRISKSISLENGGGKKVVTDYIYYSSTDSNINNRNNLWKTVDTRSYGSPVKNDILTVEYKSYDSIHHLPSSSTQTRDGAQFIKENAAIYKDFIYTNKGQIKRESTKVTVKDGEVKQDLINQYEYYPSGSIKKVIYPDGSILNLERDVVDRITSQIFTPTEGQNETTSISYSDLSRKVSMQQPDGSVIDEFYTPFGVLQKQQKTVNGATRVLLVNEVPNGKTITKSIPYGAANLGTSYDYDTNGRVVQEINPLGQTTNYLYANVIKLTNGQIIPQKTVNKMTPAGKSETLFYDKLGQLVMTIEQSPNSQKKRITRNSYSASGELVSQSIEADGQVHTSTYKYDGSGNLIYMKSPEGVEYTYVYNSLGKIIEFYINGALQSSVKHNELGWILKKSTTGSPDQTYSYKTNGLLDKRVDQKGQTYEYTYTPFYELSRLSIKQGSSEIYWQNNVYDPVTRNLLQSTNSESESISYHWDIWQRNDQKTVAGKTYTIGYDEYDRMQSITYPDNSKTSYEYDSLNRQKNVAYGSQLNTILNWTVSTDAYKKTTQYNIGQGEIINAEVVNNSFGELVQANTTNVLSGDKYQETFALDGFGNISNINKNGVANSFTYDSMNRIKTESGAAANSYIYNSKGDRTEQNSSDLLDLELGTKSYTYNAINQLTGYEDNNDSAKYTYYPDGLRATKIVNGEVTRYVYIEGKVIEELDAQGNTKARNVWNNSKLLFRQDYVNNRGGYYIYNGHGDVVKIIDNTGLLLKSYDYDIWGKIKSASSAPGNPFNNPYRYSGEIQDDESGLIYLRARYYDPADGRFVTKDTYEGRISDPRTLNLYTYVYNNPLVYVDPSGHDAYIFYGVPHGENGGFESRAKSEAAWWENNNDSPVHIFEITTEQEFIDAWNSMGEDGADIENVSLYFHSNPHNLIIDYTTKDGEYITSFTSGKTQGEKGANATSADSLKKKTIGNLIFYTCNAGHLDYSDNLAITFLKTQSVSNVYAWDGSMKWHNVVGYPTLANDQHYFKSWIKGEERKPQGLIRFYEDNSGKVQYQKVKPSVYSWMFGKHWGFIG